MSRIEHMIRGRAVRALWSIKALHGRDEGIAALEFALLMPVMIYTLLAASDIAHGLEVARRLTNTADSIAQLVSQQSTGQNVQGTVTNATLGLSFGAIITTFPDILPDASRQQVNWQTLIEPIVTSVEFGPVATCQPQPDSTNGTPATPVCTTATALWSAGFNNTGFSGTARACGALNKMGKNGDSPDLTLMPPGLYAPGNVIVVDVSYHFKPLFTYWITGPITIQRTAYLAPRFFYQLTYSPPNAGSGGTTKTYTDTSSGIYGISSCAYLGALP